MVLSYHHQAPWGYGSSKKATCVAEAHKGVFYRNRVPESFKWGHTEATNLACVDVFKREFPTEIKWPGTSKIGRGVSTSKARVKLSPRPVVTGLNRHALSDTILCGYVKAMSVCNTQYRKTEKFPLWKWAWLCPSSEGAWSQRNLETREENGAPITTAP
jgi:hypothetical protein